MSEELEAKSFDGILEDYKTSEHFHQDPRNEELNKKLEEAFERAYEARLPYERDWELYRLYIKGEQLIVRHRDTGDIVRLTGEDSKRLRSVHNALRPTVRSLVGKLTRGIPSCKVLPATADFEEQHGARVATALLEYARRKEKLDIQYTDACEYLPWAGNAFIQLYWDRKGGRKIAYCPTCDYNDYSEELVGTECPRCGAQRENELAVQEYQRNQMQAISDQQQQVELQQYLIENDDGQGGPEFVPPELAESQAVEPPPIEAQGPLPLEQEPPGLVEAYEGDFRVRVLDSRDFFVEPGSSCLDDAMWVCVRKAMHISEIRSQFPEHAEHLHPEDNLYAERTAELRFNSVDSYGETEYLRDHAYLKEFHERPTEEYPNGRVIWTVNDIVVREIESPYWPLLKRFPVYHFRFDLNKGEFWGEPFMAQAWHRQREINQIETQIREHVELVLKPKTLVPIGSRISSDEITAASAQIINYNAAAGQPSVLPFPPLPNQVFNRRNELIADVRMQAAVTEQEAGITQDVAGRAMAIIEAEADQQVGPILLRNNDEWRELHRGILEVFRAYAHPKRKFTVPGAEGVQTFSFEQLSLEPGYDVQIEQIDGLSRNPAVRLQQSLDLLNAGAFLDEMTGQPDLKAFKRHAKLNMPGSGYDLQATERAAASQIPYLIKKGQAHIPQLEDDPMIFAEELLGWLRGPGRKEDPNLADQIRQVWMFYMGWATTGQPPPGLGVEPGQIPGQQSTPGAGPGGPDQSAIGGSPNNAGNIASDVASQARQQVSQADQTAESQARVQQNREG